MLSKFINTDEHPRQHKINRSRYQIRAGSWPAAHWQEVVKLCKHEYKEIKLNDHDLCQSALKGHAPRDT